MLMDDGFVRRLQLAFGGLTMAGVARRLDLPHATIRNYFQGRLPAPEVLIKIADATGVSLNWLLSGSGEMFVADIKGLDLGPMLEMKIDELIERKLKERETTPAIDLGDIDVHPDFAIDDAVRSTDDPQVVMQRWLEHEGRAFPADYGIVFFNGWETFSFNEKLAAVRDAKRVLDRSLKH